MVGVVGALPHSPLSSAADLGLLVGVGDPVPPALGPVLALALLPSPLPLPLLSQS